MSMLPKIDTPIYTLTVPSTKKEIQYRPFLVKEEKILIMALEQNADEKDSKTIVDTLKKIIENCTFNKINVDNLTSFDLEYIFIMLRSVSKGGDVRIGFECHEELVDGSICNNVTQVNFNLNDIQVKEHSGHNKKIQLTDNVGITMKYPDFDTFSKLNFTRDETDTTSTLVNDIILKCIDSVFTSDGKVTSTKDVDKKELEEFFEQMSTSHMEKIKQFFETMPTVEAVVSYTCSKCGKEHKDLKVTGLQNFLT